MKIQDIKKISEKLLDQTSEYWHIILQYESTCTILLNQLNIHMEQGDICIIPPSFMHSFIPSKNSSLFIITTHDFRPFGESRVLLLHDDLKNPLSDLLSITLYYWNIKETNIHNAIINSLGDAFYHGLAALYAKSQTHDFRIEGILDLMYTNISNANFNLKECLHECGYCDGYFRRLFKKMTGNTPSQFMNHIRIDHAKSLIKQFGDSKTLKEISYACGFEDPLYFSRLFKKQEGISPRDFKNEMYK